MEFKSIAAFTEFFATRDVAVVVAAEAGLEKSAQLIERRAKEKIGEYQEEAGPFPAWEPLSPSTLAEKERLGYAPPDNPLLRTGDMRDSIEHRVEGLEAQVGSNNDVAVYQELGTARIPARSFLGGAAVEKEKEVVELIGGNVMLALAARKKPSAQ